MIIPVENFSKQEGRSIVQIMIEFLPETKVNMTDCVYSQAIKTVFSDNFVSYPIKKDLFNLFTFCIEIWETEKSAFFNSFTIILLVVFIFNVTGLMIMCRFVEWNDP
jgi:hypothetical protein